MRGFLVVKHLKSSPIFRRALPHNWLICSVNFKCESMLMPRSLVFQTFTISELYSLYGSSVIERLPSVNAAHFAIEMFNCQVSDQMRNASMLCYNVSVSALLLLHEETSLHLGHVDKVQARTGER